MYRHALTHSKHHLLLPSTRTPITPHLTLLPHRTHSDSPTTRRNHPRPPKQKSSPHYLIPQAYRRRDDKSRHPSYIYRPRNSSRSPSNVRHRRRKGNNFMKRQSNKLFYDVKPMERETLLDMEKELSGKLNEYGGRMNGHDDFATVAQETNEREERERDFPFTMLSGAKEGNDVSVADLYGTEEMFTDISSKMKALIVGYCGAAEGVCAMKRMENFRIGDSEDNKVKEEDKEQGVGVKDYEMMVTKAETYLEAWESFHRNRVEAVVKGKELLEKRQEDLKKNESGAPVFKEMGSFLRGVFSNPLSTKSPNEFDETWQRADGTKTNNDVTAIGEVNLDNYHDLIRAHENGENKPNVELYMKVISANTASYHFGKRAKNHSAERSNRLLTRWISLNCLQTKNEITTDSISSQSEMAPSDDDPFNDAKYPEQRLFHLVMRQNTDLWTKDGSQRTEEWLRRMETLEQEGHVRCAPDIHAYNLVLLSYCNLCKSASGSSVKPQASNKPRSSGSSFDEARESSLSRGVRQYVMHNTEKILDELTNRDGIDMNVLSLNLALQIMAKAGMHQQDLCQKTDRLLQQVLGEDSFHQIVDNETPFLVENIVSSPLQPDLDTYHWIINIYSRSGNLFYIKNAMVLLDKMTRLRVAIESSEDGDYNLTTPSTGTFNSVLRALQFKVNELWKLSDLSEEKLSSLSDQSQNELKEYSPLDIAKSVSKMVDSMVQFDSSLPSRVTFLYMLQIWSKTRCQEAGDRAEELMSRIELINSYNSLTPFSNAYKIVLQCWLTSAYAGRPGAVDRANRLLEIIDAQLMNYSAEITTGEADLLSDVAMNVAMDGINDGGDNNFNVFDQTNHDFSRLYPTMLMICAAAEEKHDTARAVAIALQTYDNMIKRGIKPSGKTFELIYCTVENYIQQHSHIPEDEKKQLRDNLFAEAEKHDVRRGELNGRLHQLKLRSKMQDANEETDREPIKTELVKENDSNDQMILTIK